MYNPIADALHDHLGLAGMLAVGIVITSIGVHYEAVIGKVQTVVKWFTRRQS
ncbi:hypothetical protein J2S40_004080 [Nocardioides luteus]|uniref:Uncharacterized protein n=1 Tax=Nocardioides luteus TaxID=1844 RepID=A0ABQ5SPK8_9ACTN|nr:hypothetical protein [Nocardioides luteus]MDR7313022.1 hypothetical protein [Nocardioides luteus]GGR44607.1 hypothetical protein GCM10010197_07790 [Nocardioides luteus]GLJ66082.1 hypothetical protein GCM10017579_01180 [Nocardioides luteus]